MEIPDTDIEVNNVSFAKPGLGQDKNVATIS
jgi:hypothetical protein